MITSKELQYWFLQTLAMLITAFLIPRFTIRGPIPALIMVVLLGIVNTTVWDVALFLSVPNSLTIHTLTVIVANGILFWILVKLIPGVEVNGILPALAAPIVFSLVSIVTYRYGREIDWPNVSQHLLDGIQKFRDSLVTPQKTPAPLPR